jgi:hypothetical protein
MEILNNAKTVLASIGLAVALIVGAVVAHDASAHNAAAVSTTSPVARLLNQ